MASTKRSALASNPIVDVTALHQYNTTNFVQYASFELEHQASSRKQQASSTKRFKQQAASIKLRATSIKRQAASSKLLDFIALIKIREARSEGLYFKF
jgi:hypothetical protein